ncbi:MAG: response regulator [Thermoplasmata archaeon]|nr:MAG: response regulator [Thermoplasmata archaeon]
MKRIILVIDDEESIQELIAIYLSPLNVDIYPAYTGEDGVKLYESLLAQGKRPDAVIMDLKLPGINGIEATKRIKKIDPDAVIYGFTAFTNSWAREMIRAGAKKVIPRSMGFSGLREIIRSSLEKRRVLMH